MLLPTFFYLYHYFFLTFLCHRIILSIHLFSFSIFFINSSAFLFCFFHIRFHFFYIPSFFPFSFPQLPSISTFLHSPPSFPAFSFSFLIFFCLPSSKCPPFIYSISSLFFSTFNFPSASVFLYSTPPFLSLFFFSDFLLPPFF